VSAAAQPGTTTPWHALATDEIERTLGTGPAGLSAREALARCAAAGPNELPREASVNDLAILARQLRNPFSAILGAALAVSVVLGDVTDAVVIAIVLVLDVVIGFMQEREAERSLEGLRSLLAPHANVVRDGRETTVAARDLVPGDLVTLASGARVPADVRLVETSALLVDDSLLTGESVAARKTASALAAALSPADRENVAWSGTLVHSGRGRGYVFATGAHTALGAIAARVSAEPRAETPLQRRVASLARVVAMIVIAASAAIVAIGAARGGSPADLARVGVALAVAAVPEGLPVAFTIGLAVAVRRMARRKALVRRLGAVETLGSTTVIGSDKTGTLTEGRMTVREAWAGGRRYVLDGVAAPLPDAAAHSPLGLALTAGILASEAQLSSDGAHIGDPTEVALLIAATRFGLDPAAIRAGSPSRQRRPFEPERRYASSVHDHEGTRSVFVAGAPERVLEMSSLRADAAGVTPLDRNAIAAIAAEMGVRGLRVIATACGPATGEDRLEGLTFLGLVGMADAPRAGAQEAVAGCQRAGIRVVMITGDHPSTAVAVARELGLGSRTLTGAEIDELDADALRERVATVDVFARVSPEQKLRIVVALRERGEIVAVTGDGANDAPALKAAHIGVAMGRGGTDVARDAADIVLTDDAFATIFAAVKEGRVTFDNLRKITFFLLSTGVAEVLTIVIAIALGWPLVLLPAQILWLNLVTEGLQDVALAFDPGEPDILERRPRSPREGILSPLMWRRTLLAGGVMAAGTLMTFRATLDAGRPLAEAQAIALTTMVLFQTFHLASARSERRSAFTQSPLTNRFLLLAAAAGLGIHLLALALPLTRDLLRITAIDPAAWPAIVATSATILVAMELDKLVGRRREGPRRGLAARG